MSALRIGVSCHPTTGGSGIIATEIGLGLARRGHQVHFISSDVPWHLVPHLASHSFELPGSVSFHRVSTPEYPLPNLGLYPLALAARLAEVSAAAELDLIHAHYSLPHAVSALLARQILHGQGMRAPRLVVTLHGTDVTQLGSAPELLSVNRLALLSSDGLTVPSIFLEQAAREQLGIPESVPIEVIPNFVDTDRFRPEESRAESADRREGSAWVLCHSSNFRKLKRIDHVVEIFARVAAEVPAQLLLLGDGPERPVTEAQVRELGLERRVRFCGMQQDVVEALQQSDLFLLPSDTEGFGLAALEALSCGVPVVASRVGGVPEVITEGVTGLLCAPGDVEGMAAAVLRLVRTPGLHREMARAARQDALRRWQQEPRIAAYEAYYRKILGARDPQGASIPVVPTCTSSR
jgi:N-acetyl-alpha-D-glucosaminyl L-malate synthase BshA